MFNKRSFFIFFATAGYLTNCSCWATEMLTFDPQSFARAGEMLSVTNTMVGQLTTIKNDLNALQKITGIPLIEVDAFRLKEQFIQNLLKPFKSAYIDHLSSISILKGANNDVLNFTTLEGAKAKIAEQLFPKQSLQSAALNGLKDITTSQLKTRNLHENALTTSSLNGAALSQQQKASLKSAHENLENLAGSAMEASSLHADLRATNQLLSLIASELIQQRALIAQHLELQATTSAYHMPVVFREETARGEQVPKEQQQGLFEAVR